MSACCSTSAKAWATRRRGNCASRFAQQLHAAVAWLAQPGQHLQQRGLAGTVGADDAQGFTGDNAQFDIAEHGIAGQLQPQVLAAQGGQSVAPS
ncbi:hypothetical protein PPS11_44233 [Pseudomonas putida S11]|nr:hypothetical protein PPS11_44233 [Pseudomonas putida S11]